LIASSFARVSALVLTFAAIAACTTVPTIADPGTPAPQTKQNPGHYRVMVGDFEVTALSDGTLAFDTDKWLTNAKPAFVKKALARFYLQAPPESSVNAFLVNTGSKLVLVDTGSGALFGPALGKILLNMEAAGYKPEQVDEIYITHLHADHAGGLMSGDKMAFPNAVVRADKHDSDFWLSDENLKNSSEGMKMFFEGARASLTPYIKVEKFKPFEGDTDLVPGVKALAMHGHTPGHTFYVAESKGQKIVFWGDLVHVEAVQLADPSVTVVFDVDSKAAAAQRKKALAGLAKQGTLIGAAHIAFPGIGRLRKDGKGYAWVPVNYSAKP
jgi:glyoxylase-like metal-dependent hydrolase (beta-lactamase superfamily II)